MTTSLMPEARQRYYNNDGTLAAGCKLYTYAAGTTTPKATYTDSAGLVPHANPIVLDAKGEAVIYWSGSYKVDLKTAAGVQITGYPVDNYTPPSDTLRTDLAAYTGSSLVGMKRTDIAGAVATTLAAWHLGQLPNVKADFGATGDGATDDTAALQAALDSNQICLMPPGKYRTTSELIASPSRNRNNGFISTTLASRYPYTAQTSGPTWDGEQEAVIFYDGSTSTSATVIRASAEAVGTEPAATFDTTVWGFTLDNVTLDANSKAGFGLYCARVQDIQLHHPRARGATVAGISINGTYSGAIRSPRCYLNPGRGFELGAADDRWSWSAQDKVNALYIYDLHCDANGSDSTFRQSDSALRKANCGVYFGPHRGAQIYGIVSENNFGANVVFEPTSANNSIQGLYTELGCKYAPGGAGTDAISLGYATDQIGLMFVGAAAATHNRVVDYACATDKVYLTGTEPTAAREEGAFELQNVALAGGLIADWGNYRLVNCAVELETISGTSPVGAYTIKGGMQFGAGLSILNTYEEGTFTPALAGATISGTGWAYSLAAGGYTRVGRLVTVTGRITLSAVSADATGQIIITGLPFTVKNGNNYHAPAAITNIVALTTSVVSISGTGRINTTTIGLQRRTAAATADSSLVLADLSATTSLTFSCTYMV